MNGRRKKGGKNKENENGDEWALLLVAQQVIMTNKYTLFFTGLSSKERSDCPGRVTLKNFQYRGGEKKTKKIVNFASCFD
jgi:hypothetical protein